MFELVLLMHFKFHEVFVYLSESLENVWFGKWTEGPTEVQFVRNDLPTG